MRFASFILAFVFLFAGPSLAGSADADAPHIGSFVFNGTPAPLVLASMR